MELLRAVVATDTLHLLSILKTGMRGRVYLMWPNNLSVGDNHIAFTISRLWNYCQRSRMKVQVCMPRFQSGGEHLVITEPGPRRLFLGALARLRARPGHEKDEISLR